MTDTNSLIHTVDADSLTELLQRGGYRVNRAEQNGLVQLLSGSQGVGFAVRFGNPGPQEGQFVDYTLSCALRVQGDLPAGLVETWNISKRFARMASQGDFLVLEMDVIVAGGVSENHMRGVAALWDRILQEFLLFYRQYAQQVGQTVAPGDGKAVSDPVLAEGRAAAAAPDKPAADAAESETTRTN